VSNASTDGSVVVLGFNDAINRRDLAALARLMSADHRFVDTEGNTVVGKSACLVAWRGFFDAFPDYRNEFEHWRTEESGAVTVTGRSRCTEPALDGPARWRAAVDRNLVVEWRVFTVH
jgi:ketosteroid isomerase-like protein